MEQRDKILEAAARVIGDKGFHAASMRDLARTAGVALGTMYLYFDSKGALLTALLDDLVANRPTGADGKQRRRSAAAALEHYVQEQVGFLRSRRLQVRAVLAEALFDKGLARAVRQSLLGPARRELARLLSACGARDPAQAAGLAWELIIFEGVMTPELGQRRSPSEVSRAVLAMAGCRGRRRR